MKTWIKNLFENYLIIATMPLMFIIWLIYHLCIKNFWNLVYILLGLSNFYEMLFKKEDVSE